MSKVIKHAVIYTGSEKIEDGYIRFDKQIEAVGRMSEYVCQSSDDEIVDVLGKTIVPGFIDVHSHGGYGFDTMDGNADEIDEMVNHMVCEGVTTYFATTMTQSHQNIENALAAVKKAAEKIPSFRAFIWKDRSYRLFSRSSAGRVYRSSGRRAVRSLEQGFRKHDQARDVCS